MTIEDISQIRLSNQHLLGEKFDTPEDAIEWLGAMQSQDYFGASWSLAQRIENATAETVDKAFNTGRILRTHIMRPTWHFILPSDIRWMQSLTSPRVKQFMTHYNRKLELDDKLFKKATKAIVKILKVKKYATRQELKTELTKIGIKTDVQRLAHIVMWAELDAVICSGPRIGKQFTYALLDDRAPKTKGKTRDEALAELTKRYFTSHGPAQIKDFSWWSGLTVKDAEDGVSMIKSKLSDETIDGKTYYSTENKKMTNPTPIARLDSAKRAYLISIYDEYTIAYKDRSALGDGRYFEKMIAMGNALTAVIIIDGKIAGTWKRVLKKATVEIKLNLFHNVNKTEHDSLKKAADNYGKFLNLPVTIQM